MRVSRYGITLGPRARDLQGLDHRGAGRQDHGHGEPKQVQPSRDTDLTRGTKRTCACASVSMALTHVVNTVTARAGIRRVLAPLMTAGDRPLTHVYTKLGLTSAAARPRSGSARLTAAMRNPMNPLAARTINNSRQIFWGTPGIDGVFIVDPSRVPSGNAPDIRDATGSPDAAERPPRWMSAQSGAWPRGQRA